MTPEFRSRTQLGFFLAVLMPTLLLACFEGNSTDVVVNTPSAPAVEGDVCGERSKISNAAGFVVPGFEGSKLKLKDHVLSRLVREKLVLISNYDPDGHELIDFDIPNRLFDAHLPTVGWTVKNITEFKVGQTPFQYLVDMSRTRAPVIVEFVYTDTDGDGTLDLVCQREGLDVPVLPRWLVEKTP